MEEKEQEAPTLLEDINLEEFLGSLEEGGEKETVETSAQDAREECLLTIAKLALDLEAGKRQSISADDIRQAFTLCDVEEVFEEAAIFFNDEEDAGEEGEDEDEDEGESED